jgi:predicted DNA repair protein MutK
MVLVATGLAMTLGVYGFVGILVKADDMGLAMTRYKSDAPLARPVHSIGRGIVKSMAPIFNGLSIVGAAAMLWVGGGMLIHGAAYFGFVAPEHLLHDISHTVSQTTPVLKGVFGWAAGAAASAALGLAAGAATDKVVKAARKGLTLHS